MRRFILGMALLCASCSAFQLPQPRPTVMPAPTEEPQSAQIKEVQVYQAVLEDSKIKVGVLAVNWTARLPLDIPSVWKKAEPDLVVLFNLAQVAQASIPKDFPLQIISSEKVPFTRTSVRADWDTLVGEHPGLVGVVEFTKVGFDKKDSKALVGYRLFHKIRVKDYREELCWLLLKKDGASWEIGERVDTGRLVPWEKKRPLKVGSESRHQKDAGNP